MDFITISTWRNRLPRRTSNGSRRKWGRSFGPPTPSCAKICPRRRGRRLLARGSPEPDAYPHLRHRLREKEGARPAPTPSGGGQEARSQETREGARPVQRERRDRTGVDPLASEGGDRPQDHGGFLEGGARPGGVRPRLLPPHRENRPMEGERAPRLLPAEHVLRHRGGRAGF